MGPRSIDYFHGKHIFINKKLWRKYMKTTGNRITYKEFTTILSTTMKEKEDEYREYLTSYFKEFLPKNRIKKEIEMFILNY